MSIQISRFLSQKLRFYTFVSIVLLLFVHGYNLKWTYLVPFSTVSEDLTFTTFFEYFLPTVCYASVFRYCLSYQVLFMRCRKKDLMANR
jgi:hypothetical protein